VFRAGEAERVKVWSKTVKFRLATCEPLVPLTVKVSGLGVEAERPLRVSVLL